ncbi:chlamydia polymorphic membrane middle domain protein, partial [Chlamydia psittaci 03DC29]
SYYHQGCQSSRCRR